MKTETIQIYVANDGTTFKDADQCKRHESESAAVEAIFKGIPDWPRGHGVFVEYPPTALMTARRDLWKLVLAKYGNSWEKWKGWDADDVHPMSIVGRVLDECGDNAPIEDAWRQMAAWDFELGRIYDQPYFVAHPDEAKPLTQPTTEISPPHRSCE